jgi:hypothetical protein
LWSLPVPPRATLAGWLMAWAGLAIALGGTLLSLQVDGNHDLVGTGYTALSIGGLVALVATLLQVGSSGRLPRDVATALSSTAAFLGVAFIVAGVLAPGGPWMFMEVFVLLWLLARRRTRAQAGGPELTGGSLFLLGLMLIFRLWITWQGSQHRWEVVAIDLPVLSWIPFDWLRPVQSVSLGSFTPLELGFPPTGIEFPLTTALWSIGFTLCAAGLWLRGGATREHENDRIHALIQTLPPGPARLVERLLPEEDWGPLGLHGLSERVLAKRIEALVAERIASHRRLHAAFEANGPVEPAPGGFAAEIAEALQRYALPPAPDEPRAGGPR